ncbi:MAG: recombination regulator RecX [Candidatus Rokuibacteriota bacterium]|nr:MAG: recombination regulator RecX [Candidatus Rokubacteria bacterium]
MVTGPRGPRRALDARTARLAAADLLSRRAWTTRELAERLRRRGAPAPVAAEVLADLTARGYLDDAAFAHHWIATRSARGYGPARLRAELRARGVAGSLVDAALAAQGDDELERARAVASRRAARGPGPPGPRRAIREDPAGRGATMNV